MYVDGVRFEYKSNPYEHAKSLGTWEGKTNCQLMVGMTFKEGIVLCVHYGSGSLGNILRRTSRKT